MSLMNNPYVGLQMILIALDVIKKDPGGRWRKKHPGLDFFTEIRKFNIKYEYNKNIKHSDREPKHKNNKELL